MGLQGAQQARDFLMKVFFFFVTKIGLPEGMYEPV